MTLDKKEFPEGKENYCPRCYFEDGKVVLRKDCSHSQSPDKANFLQVGRTIECGTCHPSEYPNCIEIRKGIEPPIPPCNCICHDKISSTDTFNIRECINGHKMTGVGFDDCCPECEAPWKDSGVEWESEFDKIYPSQKGISGGLYFIMQDTHQFKTFIRQLLESSRSQVIGEMRGIVEEECPQVKAMKEEGGLLWIGVSCPKEKMFRILPESILEKLK